MKKFPALLVIFSLSGCNDLSEPIQTVDWYTEHKIERNERLVACRRNPGELALTANCVNAEKAESRAAATNRGGLDLQPITGIKMGGK